MQICSQPRRHPHRSSIQIHGLELMSLSVLYGPRELRVVLGTQILHAAAVCSVRGSLSPLDCSMPIVQIASEALHDANDALLGVHCITRITRPHFHCFSDPRFGALSPTKLRVRPLKLCLFATSPHTPLTHFVRSKSSSLAYRLAFVICFLGQEIIGIALSRDSLRAGKTATSKRTSVQIPTIASVFSFVPLCSPAAVTVFLVLAATSLESTGQA